MLRLRPYKYTDAGTILLQHLMKAVLSVLQKQSMQK